MIREKSEKFQNFFARTRTGIQFLFLIFDIFDSPFHEIHQDVVIDRGTQRCRESQSRSEVDNANEIKFGQRFLSFLMKKNCPVHVKARNYTDSK